MNSIKTWDFLYANYHFEISCVTRRWCPDLDHLWNSLSWLAVVSGSYWSSYFTTEIKLYNNVLIKVIWLLLTAFLKYWQVYYQLENLSRADPPYKSVAALNCVILGCANIWDVDRAYQTFSAIAATFGLTPNIHSYNALICAFGKLSKVILMYSAITDACMSPYSVLFWNSAYHSLCPVKAISFNFCWTN